MRNWNETDCQEMPKSGGKITETPKRRSGSFDDGDKKEVKKEKEHRAKARVYTSKGRSTGNNGRVVSGVFSLFGNELVPSL